MIPTPCRLLQAFSIQVKPSQLGSILHRFRPQDTPTSVALHLTIHTASETIIVWRIVGFYILISDHVVQLTRVAGIHPLPDLHVRTIVVAVQLLTSPTAPTEFLLHMQLLICTGDLSWICIWYLLNMDQ